MMQSPPAINLASFPVPPRAMEIPGVVPFSTSEAFETRQEYVETLVQDVQDLVQNIAEALAENAINKDDYVPVFSNGRKTGRRRAIQSREEPSKRTMSLSLKDLGFADFDSDSSSTGLASRRSSRQRATDQHNRSSLRPRPLAPRRPLHKSAASMRDSSAPSDAMDIDSQPPLFQCLADFDGSFKFRQSPGALPLSPPATPSSASFGESCQETQNSGSTPDAATAAHSQLRAEGRAELALKVQSADAMLESSWKWNEMSDASSSSSPRPASAAADGSRPKKSSLKGLFTRPQISPSPSVLALGPIEQPIANMGESSSPASSPSSSSSSSSSSKAAWYRSEMEWDSSDDESSLGKKLRASFGRSSLKKSKFASLLRKNCND